MIDAPLHEVLAALKLGSEAERLGAAQRIEEYARLFHAIYPSLLAAAERGPTAVATHCLDAIGSLGLGREREQILRGLGSLSSSKESQVRLAAAMAIWRTAGTDRSVLREVRRALGAKDEGVVRFALAAVDEMGPEARELRPLLRKLAEHSETRLLVWIAQALWRVDGKPTASAKCLSTVLRDGTEEQKMQALLFLSSMPRVARLMTRDLKAITLGKGSSTEAVRGSAEEVLFLLRPMTRRRTGQPSLRGRLRRLP